jgi:gliding motility-associated-like protein
LRSTSKILLNSGIAVAMSFLTLKASPQIKFIQNKGQWNDKVNYRGDFSTGAFFLENKGFTVLLNKGEELQKLSDYEHGHKGKSADFTLHSFAYNVTFLGAAAEAARVPEKSFTEYNNYYIGNDSRKWASDCKLYGSVTYKNIYPNIDIHYYSAGEQLKYDFIVYPGGNPNAIAMRYDGPLSLKTKDRDLIIGTSVGDVTELSPYTYQAGVSGSSDVSAKYVIKDNVVTFDVGNYDLKSTLIIDPQLIFSTFTGSTVDNWGYTATPGPDGSFYAGGIIFGSGYPLSPGAYQTVFHGGFPEGAFTGVDMSITKFSASGSQILYSTLLGGSGNEQPHSMIVDADGNLVVAGRTNSVDYPIRTSLPASFTGTGYDIAVTKFNTTGTALIGSVKIGGSGDDGVNIRPKYVDPVGVDRLRVNYGDDARSEVILDASNNVYVVSCTQSANFPTLFPVQAVSGGAQDGVILKLTPTLSGLLYSTYFGGSKDDACFVAAINPVSGNLYVGGATMSPNLPGPTAGVISPTGQGGVDGFVTEILATGAAIVKTSFFGTSGTDLVYGLKFDKKGFPYIMGTTSGSWPVIAATFQNPGSKQFISKLKPDLSAYIYSTVFGTNSPYPNISPVAFLVDRCENVYVSGWGGGLNEGEGYSPGNTNGLPEVNPLPGLYPADGKDFYFFVLKKDAASQLFGTHFGEFGGLGDHVDGGTSRFDENGIIYQAVCANCSGRFYHPPAVFPITTGVVAPKNPSDGCNEAAVKIEMDFAGVGAQVQASINGDTKDTVGCIPLTVNFKDLLHKGVTYYWNFNSAANPGGVDLTTTTPSAVYTFTTVGTYVVRLISEDLSTCNQRDTSYITIHAGNNPVTPKFSAQKVGPCTSSTYQFTNQTVPAAGFSFGPASFVWDFGDGSPTFTTGFTPNPPPHAYPGPGTYLVKLFIVDPQFCNAPDSTVDSLRINSILKAKPFLGPLGCAPFEAHFTNQSDGGLSWLWQFDDGTTSTDFEPVKLYPNVGTYQYRLIAYDSTTCNKIDTSAYFTLTVVQKPQALADWAPNPPQANVPVRFTNLSTFADSYLWNFGDGESSVEFAPVHEYNATDTYHAQLIAYSLAGCTDTFNLTVNTLINPLLDVPNAFTPGRFGVNSIVNVRGFGITKMDWRIYNRWGQMVFQSASKKMGWDGSFKGKPLPMDVYTYTLDVQFSDGNTERKTGDITLLR